jgi:hypothetical protein
LTFAHSGSIFKRSVPGLLKKSVLSFSIVLDADNGRIVVRYS